jgi:hypothetical protein
VALPVASDVGRLEVSDRSFIDNSRGQLSGLDQVAGPLRDVRIDVVEKRGRQRFLEDEGAAINAQEARRGPVVLHVEREVARDHGLGCAGRGRQPRPGQLRDLARLERAGRDLA